MNIKHHGAFFLYAPEPDSTKPTTMLKSILHSQNAEGLDFYVLRDSIPETSLVVLVRPGEGHVCGASKGPLMAFPSAGEHLYEISGPFAEITPNQALNRILNTQTGELTPV